MCTRVFNATNYALARHWWMHPSLLPAPPPTHRAAERTSSVSHTSSSVEPSAARLKQGDAAAADSNVKSGSKINGKDGSKINSAVKADAWQQAVSVIMDASDNSTAAAVRPFRMRSASVSVAQALAAQSVPGAAGAGSGLHEGLAAAPQLASIGEIPIVYFSFTPMNNTGRRTSLPSHNINSHCGRRVFVTNHISNNIII